MEDFGKIFANGADVSEHVDFSRCANFWPKGDNSECAIYDESGKILYSCCYTRAYGKNYITSAWSPRGCEYEYTIDYDALETARKPSRRAGNSEAI
jgi:hypothetical protein